MIKEEDFVSYKLSYLLKDIGCKRENNMLHIDEISEDE
jgi:hypothetical protein